MECLTISGVLDVTKYSPKMVVGIIWGPEETSGHGSVAGRMWMLEAVASMKQHSDLQLQGA